MVFNHFRFSQNLQGMFTEASQRNFLLFGAEYPQDLLRAAPKKIAELPFRISLSVMNRYPQNFWRMFPESSVHFCYSQCSLKSVPFLNGGPLKIRHLFQPLPISPNLLRFSPNLQGMFTQASHINCEILGLKIF